MKNLLLISGLTSIIIFLLGSIGIIEFNPCMIFLILIFFIGSILGFICIHKMERDSDTNQEMQNLLRSQVSFYDLVFKIMAILLVLAGIFIFKDRQEMKERLESDYNRLVTNIIQRADSLIFDANNKLSQSIKEAKENVLKLENATHYSKTSENRLREAITKAEEESKILTELKQDFTNWVYSKEKQLNTSIIGPKLLYCQIDSTKDLRRDDKWYNNMGADYFNYGYESKAESLINKALQINPKNKVVLNNIGYIYYLKNDSSSLEKAVEYINKYIKYYPYDADGYVNKAQCLIKLKNRKVEAFTALKNALSLGCKDYPLIEEQFCKKDSIFYQLLPSELRKIDIK